MHFHILTLFPEMVLTGLATSIIGRAQKDGLLTVDADNIRDYTTEKHGHVDDYPYGGGAGMLMTGRRLPASFMNSISLEFSARNRPTGPLSTR